MSLVRSTAGPVGLSLLAVFAISSGNLRTVHAQASTFTVFGNTGVTYTGFSTTTGTVGSNSNITDTAGGILTVTALQAFGSFNGSGSAQQVSGGVAVDGTFTSGASGSFNNVSAGGSLTLNSNASGNVTAGGTLTLNANVGGNALASGSAALNSAHTVGATLGTNQNVTISSGSSMGNLVYAGTATPPPASFAANSITVTGTITNGSVTVTPQVVSTVSIPPADSFTGGGAAVTLTTSQSQTLTPGHYGALTMQGANTVNLSAGNYYFNSITSTGDFATFNYTGVTSSTPINVFVTGNVTLLGATETVNGQTFANATTGVTSTPQLASNVFWESLGTVSIDQTPPADSTNFFGSIFAPNGNITTGTLETFYGSLISGGQVSIGGSTNLTFEQSAYLAAVPEPGSCVLAVMGLAGLVLVARWRRRAEVHTAGPALCYHELGDRQI